MCTVCYTSRNRGKLPRVDGRLLLLPPVSKLQSFNIVIVAAITRLRKYHVCTKPKFNIQRSIYLHRISDEFLFVGDATGQ